MHEHDSIKKAANCISRLSRKVSVDLCEYVETGRGDLADITAMIDAIEIAGMVAYSDAERAEDELAIITDKLKQRFDNAQEQVK